MGATTAWKNRSLTATRASQLPWQCARQARSLITSKMCVSGRNAMIPWRSCCKMWSGARHEHRNGQQVDKWMICHIVALRLISPGRSSRTEKSLVCQVKFTSLSNKFVCLFKLIPDPNSAIGIKMPHVTAPNWKRLMRSSSVLTNFQTEQDAWYVNLFNRKILALNNHVNVSFDCLGFCFFYPNKKNLNDFKTAELDDQNVRIHQTRNTNNVPTTLCGSFLNIVKNIK